jgi:nucleolar protein 53
MATKTTKTTTMKKLLDAKGKKPTRSVIGAPSQHNQSSRKGKRAWRKNINIEDVEEVLEGMRAEERVVGYVIHFTVFHSQDY